MSGNMNLVRGALKINPNYKRNGMKSYVHALKRWNIGPTVDGPYCMVNQIEQQGQQAIFKKFGKKMSDQP